MSRIRFFSALFVLACLFFTGAARAADDDFLDPSLAFRFSATMADAQTIAVTFNIADGYYMYRERFKFSATNAQLGAPQIPAGIVKFDETFNKNVETYHGSVTIRIPVQAAGAFTLTAGGQGCADKGLCYSPQEYRAKLLASGGMSTPASGAQPTSLIARLQGPPPAIDTPPATVAAAPVTATPPRSELSGIAVVLGEGKLLAIVPAFVLLGLGLAFTPCVLPMVPILSSIIVGEGATHRWRGLVLSIAYSLGMAIVYTLLGVAAGLAGEGLAAALQNPWVLGAFGVVIAAMSLSMFGVYDLQLPASLQTRLAGASGRQSSGKLAGVFAMGAISALIVGPCVAAPLAGALVYISQTRDVVIGGAALFSMAVGMSIPLLLVGVSAGSLLPRAGAWMDAVKRFFGVLMLGMALWLTAPVLPPALQMVLWAALLLGYGMFLMRHTRHWAAMTAGAVFAILGAMQVVGVASGGRDALAPLAHLGGGAAHTRLAFTRIKTVAQLDAALAQTGGKTAMLDFYADWCVSCKEMEKLTFIDPAVQASLANSVLLQVDVTANDPDDKAMLKRFGLFGPPGIILFDKTGREIADSRVIGYQDARKFNASLSRLN